MARAALTFGEWRPVSTALICARQPTRERELGLGKAQHLPPDP